jgi:ABC-type glycerol-3-phosphate transport system substrate-binding protein
LALAIGLVVGVHGLFGGGTKEGAGAVATIRFAHMWQEGASDEADIATGILNALDEEHPEWEISHEVVIGDEMRNKIRVDVAANNAPDMWQFWAGGVLADYANRGILADMNEYLKLSPRLKKDHIPQGAWDLVSFDGIPRAIPRNVSIGIFGVNTELFEKHGLEYPATWQDLLALGKAFRDVDVTPTNIGSKGGNPSHFWYGDLVCQYEQGVTETLEIGNSLNFENEPFIKAAEYCDEMRKAGLFPDDVVANGDWAPSYALYEQGNTAMLYTFAWMFNDMSEEMIEKTKLIPIPPVPDAERDTSTFIQGSVNDAYTFAAASFADESKKMGLVAIMDAVAKDIGLALSELGTIVSVDNEVMARVDLDKIQNSMMRKTLAYRIENNMSGSPMIWQNLPNNKLQFDYQAALDELWAGALDANGYIEKVQASMDEYAATVK